MRGAAILVGNSQYDSLSNLPCCHNDIVAIKELLEESRKYDVVKVIENVNADELKSSIRACVGEMRGCEELFFYFSGHGHQHDEEFYYCSTNFSHKRPNETGLSNSELQTLLRLFDAGLVVKVIDACHSGALLIKSDAGFAPNQKDGFRNLIQISSCLESQTSFAGDPLSLFTEKFRLAVLRKTEGVIFYTDIIGSLRDEFIGDSEQTPFFVSQVTGREQFVEDASCFDSLRLKIFAVENASVLPEEEEELESATTPTLRTLLEKAEAGLGTSEKVSVFVNRLFDALITRINIIDFSEYFDSLVVEHADFKEGTAREFIIKVMSRENRSDNFVTATIKRERARSPFSALAIGALWGGEDYVNTYDLELNCSMKRVQIKFSFTPKYLSLQQVNLVVTCAPSLEYCYVFEVCTIHALTDFGRYDSEGGEAVRRWYRFNWTEEVDAVVEKISLKLEDTVRGHLDTVAQKLIDK